MMESVWGMGTCPLSEDSPLLLLLLFAVWVASPLCLCLCASAYVHRGNLPLLLEGPLCPLHYHGSFTMMTAMGRASRSAVKRRRGAAPSPSLFPIFRCSYAAASPFPRVHVHTASPTHRMRAGGQRAASLTFSFLLTSFSLSLPPPPAADGRHSFLK